MTRRNPHGKEKSQGLPATCEPVFCVSRADAFTESVIREMTRLAITHDAVNLAQGFPDFSCPEELKKAACNAILSTSLIYHH
jgi:aspartate/methionine/tyrosine aminotransferase